MSYQTFAHTGKTLIKAEDIGSGQVELRHLSPALFTQIQLIGLHTHSGVGSPRINLLYTEGNFPLTGFRMLSSDGKKWQVTIDTSGVIQTSQIT